MRGIREDAGFTLIEVLVVMVVFSIVSVGMYSILFSGRRGATTVQDVAAISQEARLGFNRMVRDTREASTLLSATANSYQVEADFDGDGTVEVSEFERVTYAYVPATGRITISNGIITETLIAGVVPIPGKDVFSYSSNRLEYDANEDGKTTIAELDAAQAAGASLTTDKLGYVTEITYAFEITSGDSASIFYTQAQLRNRR